MKNKRVFPTKEYLTFLGRVLGLEAALWEWAHNRPEGRFIHSSLGHELAPFCVTLFIEPSSALWSLYYRCHAWLIALGVPPVEIARYIKSPKLVGNQVSVGPMHIFIRDFIIDCNSIVAAQIPIAVGAALAVRDLGQRVICALGDGATMPGVFFESLNISVLQRVPIIFVVEDNQLAIDTFYNNVSRPSIEKKFHLFGIPILSVSSESPAEVFEATRELIEISDGPSALCIRCDRIEAHATAFEIRSPMRMLDHIQIDRKEAEKTFNECRTVLSINIRKDDRSAPF